MDGFDPIKWTPSKGIHLVLGASAGTKIGNGVNNLVTSQIAPVEIIAKKR